jgi:hypothetical protein
VEILVLLVRLDYRGLCSLLIFFLLFHSISRKTFQRDIGGGDSVISVAGESFGWVSVFSLFEGQICAVSQPPSRHAPLCCAHRRPLVQTLPFTAG